MAELADVIGFFDEFGEAISDGQDSGWDVVYLLMRIYAVETFRVRSQLLYGVAKLATADHRGPGGRRGVRPGAGRRFSQGRATASGVRRGFAAARQRALLAADYRRWSSSSGSSGWTSARPMTPTTAGTPTRRQRHAVGRSGVGESRHAGHRSARGRDRSAAHDRDGPAGRAPAGRHCSSASAARCLATHTGDDTTYRFLDRCAGAFDLLVPWSELAAVLPGAAAVRRASSASM